MPPLPQCSGAWSGGELATFDACQARKFLYVASVTTTTVHAIVGKLYMLGIGISEAQIFVITDGKTMREIATQAKASLVFVNNKLWSLTQKGFIAKRAGRPSTYHLTAAGKRAIAELTSAESTR
jgi:predicted transcriptional regulator